MSFQAVTWAFDQIRGVGATGKLVLLALAEFANDENETWRSREEISARAECSVRQTARLLKELEDAGLIKRTPRYSWCDRNTPACASRGGHKHRSGTTYLLRLDRTNSTALPEPNPTEDKMSPVEETVQLQRNPHRGQNVTCGPTYDNQSQSHRTSLTPISTFNPQLNPHTYPPPLNGGPGGGQAGKVEIEEDPSGHAPLPAPSVATDEEFTRAVALVVECLPSELHGLDRAGMVGVGNLLAQRIEAGWTPGEIRTLMRQPLPPQIRHLAGLVTHRLTTAVDPALAPAKLRLQARKHNAKRQAEATEAARDIPGEQWQEVFHAERRALQSVPDLRPTQRIQKLIETLEEKGLDEETFRQSWESAAELMPEKSPSDITQFVLAGTKAGKEGAA